MQNNPLLQGLNTAQQEAVLHGEGPAFVAAGPGSGKTFTITRRLLYLIQERRVPPQEILVITFTREAARTMQERFYSELHRFGISRTNLKGFVSFGTFHSYFYQIIKSIKKYSNYQLITQQEKYRIAETILKKDGVEEVTESDIGSFLTQVSFFKNTGRFKVTGGKAEFMENGGTDEEIRLHQWFMRYEAAMHTYKRLDFDDMLYLCRNALIEDMELLKYWQKRFSYILIDEYQDINSVQREIIQLLCVPPYNLFVVGDDDQAIYGFRGSEADIFQRFLQEYPNAAKIYLVKNYRCSENIVKASKRLIEQNKHRVTKELESASKSASKGQIQAIGAARARESYEKVVLKLKEKSVEELDREAVLFRTNSAMQMFATQLSRSQVPFVLRERFTSIYEHFLVKDIMDYFLAAQGCRDRSLFLRIFQKQRVNLGREAFRTEQVDLAQVKTIYSSGFYESRQAVESIEALERHLERLSKMRPGLGINYILHAMDYQGYLLRKCGNSREIMEEWKQLLDWLREDAESYCDFAGWQAHQMEYAKELEREKATAQKEKQGVHLLTLHASKGLEFDKVYIMNLNEGTMPQLRRGEVVTEEKIEEERRLFYVGMTRARAELELHYVTGTRENPRMRSRFIEEVGNM